MDAKIFGLTDRASQMEAHAKRLSDLSTQFKRVSDHHHALISDKATNLSGRFHNGSVWCDIQLSGASKEALVKVLVDHCVSEMTRLSDAYEKLMKEGL